MLFLGGVSRWGWGRRGWLGGLRLLMGGMEGLVLMGLGFLWRGGWGLLLLVLVGVVSLGVGVGVRGWEVEVEVVGVGVLGRLGMEVQLKRRIKPG